MNKRLIELVIEQFGDEQYFFESAAEDITNHGADTGWSGFTYYNETVPFGEKIRALVKPMIEEYAESKEDCIFNTMSGWKCLNGYSADEIAEGWCSNENEQAHTAVMNAIAWFALEEAARDVVNQREQVIA